MDTFLNWAVSLFQTLLSWLSAMQIVEGVTLLGFLGACFVFGLLIRYLLFRAR